MNEADIKREVRETEEMIRDLALKAKISQSLTELHQHQEWIRMSELLRDVEQRELELMRTLEMTPYQLGRRQGYLRSLRILGNAKPLTNTELAEIEQASNLASERLIDLRKLLE